MFISLFFFNDTATTEIYTLSLHDALPICCVSHSLIFLKIFHLSFVSSKKWQLQMLSSGALSAALPGPRPTKPSKMLLVPTDRKSTRLNSSHVRISYAVFCLTKKQSQSAII